MLKLREFRANVMSFTKIMIAFRQMFSDKCGCSSTGANNLGSESIVRLFLCHALPSMHYPDTCLPHVCFLFACVFCMQHDISLRTKTDGSLARILLQPGNLNPMLPPSDILRVGVHRIDLIAFFFLRTLHCHLSSCERTCSYAEITR